MLTSSTTRKSTVNTAVNPQTSTTLIPPSSTTSKSTVNATTNSAVGTSSSSATTSSCVCTTQFTPPASIRLVGGGEGEGRVEVLHDNVWGTVCDDLFTETNVKVICYSLGFGYVGRSVRNKYGVASGQIWLDNVVCKGTETFIGDCRHNVWGVHDCQHSEDVAVSCFNNYTTTTTQTTTTTTSTATTTTITASSLVRLVGSSSAREGRLEVYHSGVWGTVCDDSFGTTDAQVACYSLGFGYVGQSMGNYYGAGTGTIWLDNLQCTGYETYIGDCPSNGWGMHDCSHSEDVSITCYSTPISQYATTTTPSSVPSGPCGLQFACNNGECVRYSYRCNGFRDCTDGSDEVGCSCDTRSYFTCANGACLSRCNVCNGYRECTDGSDERDCPCQRTQFQCDNGACVSSSAMCNGIFECTDSSDEAVCSCNSTQFKCVSPGSQCISVCKRCDGVSDCLDNSDETDCSCPDNRFRCSSGQCISSCKRCDGRFDCTDHSDESNCTYCSVGDFNCVTGNQCVRSCARCDGVFDCNDYSDEFNCNCTAAQYRCRNGQCIPAAAFCDRTTNCLDGTDEQDCPCLSAEFTCVVDGHCVPLSWRCDGFCDCLDCSEEANCPFTRLVGSGSNPREGRLEVLHRGLWGTVCPSMFDDTAAKVACRSLGFGYVGWKVTDYYTNPGSGQIWLSNVKCFGYEKFIGYCKNNGWGSFNCDHSQDVSIACYNGSRPVPGPYNGTVLRSADTLYVTDSNNGYVYAINIATGSTRRLPFYVYYPAYVVYDQNAQNIYVTSYYNSAIYRFSLLTNTSTIIYYVSNPFGLALDAARQKIYYVDAAYGRIGEISTSGSDNRILFNSTYYARSLVFDSTNRVLYWTDMSYRAIYRSSVVNINKITIWSTATGQPSALAIDFSAGVMYWSDSALYTIDRAYLDGSGHVIVSTNTYQSIYGFSLDASFLYFADYSYGYIYKMNRNTSSVTRITTSQTLYSPIGLVAASMNTGASQTAYCSSSQFQCLSSGSCISIYYTCDGYCDCGDCSDELSCVCGSTQFRCNDTGTCVPLSNRCTGICSCNDCSDEFNCTCTSSQFKCLSNGRCLSTSYRCNGVCDCTDCSDENNCTCTSTQYKCSAGRCLPGYQRCDGIVQCPGGDDELNCGGQCAYNQRKCGNGWCLLTKAQCYLYASYYTPYSYQCSTYLSFWCDGYIDCPDAMDERNCTGTLQPPPSTTPRPGLACNSSGQYQCANGWCISTVPSCSAPWCRSWNFRCDGYSDCPDGSDEARCTAIQSRQCRPGQFKCSDNSSCISSTKICNGYLDCRDGSDERNCPCPYSYQWKCGSGECINSYYRCDGVANCLDASDEFCNCSASQFRCANGQCTTVLSRCSGISYCKDHSDQAVCVCGPNQFQCSDYSCVSKCRRCDGHRDCSDGSDELNCTCNAVTQFQCRSGECLDKCKRCDGQVDCLDFSDELNCSCPTNSFRCANSLCIPACQQCDGYSQCNDNSDEANCAGINPCSSKQFRCVANNRCVPYFYRCDGICDCSSCTDEVACDSVTSTELSTTLWVSTTTTPATYPPHSCSSYYVPCTYSSGCIYYTRQCDGYCDCYLCSDETNCTCTSSQFRCASGRCISTYYRCDGSCYCDDCSDELNCVCTSSQFRCNSGRCISSYYRCDGSCYCDDCSDERNCTCSSSQFRCASGQCVSLYNECDNYCGCSDCSDEWHCVCSALQFKCNNGRCVSSSYRCDGSCSCSDCSDEDNCSCSDYGYQCQNGRCYLPSEACDGVNNCGDYTDELNCYCSSYYSFQCAMGLCLPSSAYCNGTRECPDGSDETPNCRYCSYTSFSCNNGRCISRSYMCDGKNDCGDYSDEVSCTCASNEYKCQMGLCVNETSWCDGYNDCPDGSDELPGCNTTCPGNARLCASTRKCIPASKLCDDYQDCPDDSDEVNCTCASYQYGCINGRCIYRDWLCDGVKDCPLGDDELLANCTRCRANQFQCSHGNQCLNATQQCDGIIQCADSSDEGHCVSLNGTAVTVNYHGVSSYRICSDQWTSGFSDSLCRLLGFPSAVSTRYVNISSSMPSSLFLQLQSGASASANILLSLSVGSCTSRQVVSVTCSEKVCGQRAFNVTQVGPYIINGNWASRGAWPWQIMLMHQGQFYCGGSLLNSRWVMTAGHCVYSNDYLVTASQLYIRLGAILASNNDPDLQTVNVSAVYAHPSYDPYEYDNDIALLRLSRPVNYTETIRPICLPSADVDLNKFTVCVDTGFGRTGPYDVPSPRLLQAKMNIMSFETCYSLLGSYRSYINNNTMLCVGSIPTEDIGVCYGDSGGPLACKDQQDTWTVIGINSFGFNSCSQSIVARVSAFSSWVQQTINSYS